MNNVFESTTVTVRKPRYDELLKKEAAFDAYKRKVKDDIKRGWSLTEIERALFLDDEPELKLPDFMSKCEPASEALELTPREVATQAHAILKSHGIMTEKPEAIFTDEEWDKLCAEAEQAEDKEV